MYVCVCVKVPSTVDLEHVHARHAAHGPVRAERQGKGCVQAFWCVCRSMPCLLSWLWYCACARSPFPGPVGPAVFPRWKYATGTSSGGSSPSIDSDGTVYVGADAALAAVNGTTGQLLWSFQTGASVTATPALYGGSVYFGSEDQTIYAVSASTGG